MKIWAQCDSAVQSFREVLAHSLAVWPATLLFILFIITALIKKTPKTHCTLAAYHQMADRHS